jgi:20S proteasome subunit beta 7
MLSAPEVDINNSLNGPTNHAQAALGPSKRTLSPSITGTSILAVKYKGGVAVTSDTLGSYGSLARFFAIERLRQIGDYTVLGAGGDYSDYQHIVKLLDELVNDEFCRNDGSRLYPEEIYNYLSRVLYNRRNKMNPLWNYLVVAGFRDGESFLGHVDLLGTCYKDDFLATGYGGYIALPLIRKAWRPDFTKEEAVKLLEDCMRVLFYRDARSSNKIQIATLDDTGIAIGKPFDLETYHWDSGERAIRGDKY